MSSALILFMFSSSESEVHQEFDFLLVRGLRVVAADHGHAPTLAAQTATPPGDTIRRIAAHRSARRAARLRYRGDVEVVVMAGGVLLVADLPLHLEVDQVHAVGAELGEQHLSRALRAAHRAIPMALGGHRVDLAGGAVHDSD